MSTLIRAARACATGSTRTLQSAARSASEGALPVGGLSNLRERLNKDVEANKSRLLQAALSEHTPAAQTSGRASTISFAARLQKHLECQLDPDTPRSLDSAMAPSTQCRLVADTARPPYNVVWASSAFQALTNRSLDQLVGKPVLEVMSQLGCSAVGNSSIANSLRYKQRDCGVVSLHHGQKAGRMTMSPLVNAKHGAASHMLFVVKGL